MPIDTDSYKMVHHPMYFVWYENVARQFALKHPELFKEKEVENINIEFVSIKVKFLHPAILYNAVKMQIRLLKQTTKKGKELLRLSIICKNANTYEVLNDGVVEVLVSGLYE